MNIATECNSQIATTLSKQDEETPETSVCSKIMLAQNFIQSRFAAHMNEHGISFATSEECNVHLSIFATKDAFINEHNAQSGSYLVGHNKFST